MEKLSSKTASLQCNQRREFVPRVSLYDFAHISQTSSSLLWIQFAVGQLFYSVSPHPSVTSWRAFVFGLCLGLRLKTSQRRLRDVFKSSLGHIYRTNTCWVQNAKSQCFVSYSVSCRFQYYFLYFCQSPHCLFEDISLPYFW